MHEHKRQHDFLVGIDSDGCAFDTMEVKHKECFIPQFISHYHLQGVSKFAREAAEFVNLYSKSRGCNRFLALVEQLDWLGKRPEVRARGVDTRVPAGVSRWIAEETKLGNPALEAAVATSGDADLRQALAWSIGVNQTIGQMVHGVPPFPFLRESLEKLVGKADMLVVSATPNEALQREWKEHGIDRFVDAICGQETGSKKETLAASRQYEANHTLMIGDAPGDYNAAVANNALFFPINPCGEEESWQQFVSEGAERFFSGTFAGEYQRALLTEFEKRLPERPPWPVVD